MASIRENLASSLGTLHLPDFCNLGTWLRVLLAVNGLVWAAALYAAHRLSFAPPGFLEAAVYVEPASLISMVILCSAQSLLRRLPPWLQRLTPLAAALAATGLMSLAMTQVDDSAPGLAWIWLWTVLIVLVLQVWFDLAARAYAPAVAEARLMALTARIRPHFLFNSLNAVLGVIRSDPRRAESAIEELADLFRSLMQDNRQLVPLAAEIALSRQYIDLERLRLGERLQVCWNVDSCPDDALVPPLMLQPLLENAVYHGVEPLSEPGQVTVTIDCHRDRLRAEIINPLADDAARHHSGNRMALANIRERLSLFYDLEAELTTASHDGQYRVTIELPYRRGETK